jgi:DNA topoisomerase 2-associated protein PAT1
MTQYEKEMIAKIQISQLVTDSPFKDDFYYQVYTSLMNQQKLQKQQQQQQQEESQQDSESASQTKQGGTMKSKSSGSASNANSLQNQMQKLIEGRKQKQKGSTCA